MTEQIPVGFVISMLRAALEGAGRISDQFHSLEITDLHELMSFMLTQNSDYSIGKWHADELHRLLPPTQDEYRKMLQALLAELKPIIEELDYDDLLSSNLAKLLSDIRDKLDRYGS